MQGDRSDPYVSNYLSILYFNARSLDPKFDELCALCDMEKPDVLCITETWLCTDIVEAECSDMNVLDLIAIDMVEVLHCSSQTV